MKQCIAALLSLGVLASACSTGGQKFTRSGFMERYDRLEKLKQHGNAAFWRAPGYRPSEYESVLVAPVEWRSPRRERIIETRLKEELRGALIEVLSHRYRIVEKPEPSGRTLTIRSAITNTRRTRWFVNAPAQVVSTLTLGGLSVFAPLQGGASVEVEARRDGEIVAQLAFYRNGKPWNVKGSYVAYDHARLAFKDAAKRLDDVLCGAAVGK